VDYCSEVVGGGKVVDWMMDWTEICSCRCRSVCTLDGFSPFSPYLFSFDCVWWGLGGSTLLFFVFFCVLVVCVYVVNPYSLLLVASENQIAKNVLSLIQKFIMPPLSNACSSVFQAKFIPFGCGARASH